LSIDVTSTPDEFLGFLDVGELGGELWGLGPIVFAAQSGFEPCLGVEDVIEFLFFMNLAIMDVNSGKKDLSFGAEARGKLEGHGMKLFIPFLELKDSEPVVGIGWNLVPNAFGEFETVIEAREIGDGGDKGGLKGADLLDFERIYGFWKRVALMSETSGFAGEALLEIFEEVGVAREIDEFDRVFTGAYDDGNGKNHGDIFGGIEAHFVDQRLVFSGEEAGKNLSLSD